MYNINLDALTIRKANEIDLPQIAKVKIDGWQTVYRKIIDKEVLDNLSIDQEIKSLQKYDLNDIFIIENHESILAFCRVYDYTTPQYNSDIDCEIREIYVCTNYRRLGIGTKLFKYVLNYFQDCKKHKLYLGVFEKNYSARNFYKKMGGKFFKNGYLTINNQKYPTVSYVYQLN